MRRLGLILVGLGAFLLVTAMLVKFYAYPKLAVAPKNQDSVTTLVGPGATIFDTSTLKEVQTDLTRKVRTIGDVKAADEQGGNAVVWYSKSSTKSSDGVVRSRSTDKVAFNATTGEAIDCCGTYEETEEGQPEEITYEGLLVKFPFNTQKQTYDFWDGNLRKTFPIKYLGTEEIEGLTVYKFEHVIEPTQYATIELPLSLLGEAGEGNVEAPRFYSNTRTLWVEPETGVIIKRNEAQDNTINYNDEPKLTTTKVSIGYDDVTVKENVDKYAPLASGLKLARTTLPIGFGLLGLLALIGGAFLARRPEAEPAAESAA
ncbi:MAG: DUF3068 domain-containing protein [Nocardioides sp.]